jgi:hypothetical protein
MLLEAAGVENVVNFFTAVLIKGREAPWNAGWRHV